MFVNLKHYIRESIRSVNSNTLVRPVNSSNFVHPVDIRTADCNKPLRPVINSSKPVRPVDVCKAIRPVNSNKIVRTVTSDKPVNSNVVRPVNSSKPERLVDVRKSVRPVNSNKPVYPVDVCKSLVPVDVCKPVCLVDIRKPFLVDYWRHISLLLILLLFAVSINTSVFNRTILHIILFINTHMTYLVFTNFFKVYICYFNR